MPAICRDPTTRRLLIGAASILPVLASLVRCSSPSAAAEYQTAKAYLDAAVTAVLAGSQQYLAGPPVPSAQDAATVKAAMDKLIAAKATVDGTYAVSDWKLAAKEVVQVVEQLVPLVETSLGAAAPYVPIAIVVINTFIAALPPPANTPPVPPAQLTRKAAEYRRRAN